MKRSVLIFLGTWLAGCGGPFGTDEGSQFRDREDDEALLVKTTFQVLYQKILKPDCEKCHAEVKSETALSAWVIGGDPQQSPLYQAVVSGRMPKAAPPLSKHQVTLLERYIKRQPRPVPPVPPEPVDPPDELGPNFEMLKKELFLPSCSPCHEGTDDDYMLPLGTYEEIRAEASSILDEMEKGKMPPKFFKGPRPSPELIDQFKRWIKKDFP